MSTDDLKRVVTFIEGLEALTEETGLVIADGYLWDDGTIICGVDSGYEVRTV